jgi:hypothetical protein
MPVYVYAHDQFNSKWNSLEFKYLTQYESDERKINQHEGHAFQWNDFCEVLWRKDSETAIRTGEVMYDLKQKKLIIIAVQVEEDGFERIIRCNCTKKENIFNLN